MEPGKRPQGNENPAWKQHGYGAETNRTTANKRGMFVNNLIQSSARVWLWSFYFNRWIFNTPYGKMFYPNTEI